MKKAAIKKYYQIVDEKGITIDNAHTYQQAIKIKKEYEES